MTTLCENFACTFHEAGGGSQNHIMLGGWDAWLHSSIAGLDAVVNGSVYGWKELVVRVSPGVIPELKAVSSERQTPFGQVSFAWSYSNAKFTQELKLPVGTTATVHAPDSIAGRRLRSIVHVESSGTCSVIYIYIYIMHREIYIQMFHIHCPEQVRAQCSGATEVHQIPSVLGGRRVF